MSEPAVFLKYEHGSQVCSRVCLSQWSVVR